MEAIFDFQKLLVNLLVVRRGKGKLEFKRKKERKTLAGRRLVTCKEFPHKTLKLLNFKFINFWVLSIHRLICISILAGTAYLPCMFDRCEKSSVLQRSARTLTGTNYWK